MTKPSEHVTEKFRRLRERAGLSMDALAHGMGYARASSIQRYEDPNEYRKEFISPDLALKLSKVVVGKGTPPIEAGEVWALTRPANGSFISSFDPDAFDAEPHEGGEGYSREDWRSSIKGAIPEIDVKLGAGEGSVGEVINLPVSDSTVSGHQVVAEWVLPDNYLRNEVRASPSSTLILGIIGDSMFPTYSPGDRVIVDLAQDRLVDDTVYAISDGYAEPQIKRLQRVPFTDPTEVRIISDNPNLETFTVELSRLKIIGRICGRIARV